MNAAIGLPALSFRAFTPVLARAVLNSPIVLPENFHVSVFVFKPMSRLAVMPVRLAVRPAVIGSLNTT